MKILALILTTCLMSNVSLSQFAIGGGPALLKAFGVQQPYVGFQVMGEYPIDEQSSYYGKVSFYGKHKGVSTLVAVNAIDFNTQPSFLEINSRNSFNYTSVEGGRRYYFGNGYDYGFAPYGGTHLMAVFNTAKLLTDDYDKSKYQLNTTESKGNIFSLAFGLSGGLKNDFAWGTLYFDASFDYFILLQSTNDVATNAFNEHGSQLLFTFGLGYKKTIF
jgi:hypothetical protein